MADVVVRPVALPSYTTPASADPGTGRRSVLAVSWCCSVGTTWTLELRAVGGQPDAAPIGPVLDWICSGVPTELPAPERDTEDLLGERELQLFPDAEPLEPEPRTRSRRLVGYATRDEEVMRLALRLAEILEGSDPGADDEFSDIPDAGRTHPMPLAARWLEARFSADAAADWVAAGVFSPRVARSSMCTELDRMAPSGWWRG
ncbi:MAG TPA: hypothetical protein VGI84_06075 [Pseudonocardiaceae bacterium]